MEDNIIDNAFEDGVALSLEGQKHLQTAGKWAYFVGIIGVIMCVLFGIGGIVGLVGVGAMSAMDSSPMDMGAFTGVMIVFIIITVAYIIPCIYLIRFAIQASKGFHNSSGHTVSKAMKDLKLFLASFSIITILFYLMYFISIMVSMVSLGRF